MKRLHLLVLKSFFGPFVLIFFIVLFILLMQFLWRYIDDLVGKGLEFKVIAELLLYTSSSLVPMALPLAILMSSLMTFGNMGEFYELTAIKASGISLQRIMMPLVILIIFMSIGAFFFANEVLPFTNLKMRSLLYDVRNQRPEIQIVPGSFYNGIQGYSLRVDRKDPNTNMLYDVKIYDHTKHKGNTNVIIADSGKMIVTTDERNLIFTLYNGCSYNEVESDRKARRNKTYPHRYDTFTEQRMIIELVGFSLTRTDENLFRNHYSMLNLSQLESMADSITKEIDKKQTILASTLIRGNYFRKRDRSRVRRQTIPKISDSLRKTYTEEHLPALKYVYDTHRVLKKKTNREEYLINQPFEQLKQTIAKEADDSTTRTDTNLIGGKRIVDDVATTPKKSDTLKQAGPQCYDSLINILTIKEKDIVLDGALSYARSARTYVVNTMQSIKSKTKRLRRFEVEWHRKFTIAFSCFLFLLIGAPLGAIIRKGGLGLPMVISTLFFIFYYIISLMGEKIVRESALPDYQGMWIASAIFLTVGIFLTYKATTDAAILNIETYTILFRKIPGLRRMSLLEVLGKESVKKSQKIIKHDTIVASLSSFRDTVNELNNDVLTRLKFSGFLVSLVGLRESSNIVLNERLYKNIIRSIKHSDLFQEQAVQAKLNEFPNFKYRNYIDLKGFLFFRLILLLIPPVTLIILIRHYIQLMMLKARLETIDQLTEDLILLIQKTDILNN
ncbi:hypothetical protein ES705_06677 [subsurface metagenome]